MYIQSSNPIKKVHVMLTLKEVSKRLFHVPFCVTLKIFVTLFMYIHVCFPMYIQSPNKESTCHVDTEGKQKGGNQ